MLKISRTFTQTGSYAFSCTIRSVYSIIVPSVDKPKCDAASMPFRAAVANEWPGTFVTNYFLEIIAVGIALLAQSTITITPIAAGWTFTFCVILQRVNYKLLCLVVMQFLGNVS